MTLEDIGYTPALEQYRKTQKLDSFAPARVVSEHKERYRVKTSEGELEAELIGNLRYTATDRYDFPAVGDWVAISEYDQHKALIHAIFPRTSIIERQAVGQSGQVQIIATNIDYGLIVQAVDRDFNINRLERYLTICHASKVNPIVVLSKVDLIDAPALESALAEVRLRLKDIPLVSVSSHPDYGYHSLAPFIEKGKTYCLLGSSGVGKSTLLNHLSGKTLMKTGEISDKVRKGKHLTTHRELVVMQNGGILIDNPGMREVGISDVRYGVETTFEAVLAYAERCRFKDCTHLHEAGCAVREAVEQGEIDRGAFDNFLKLQKEKMHFESSSAERKRKDKELGKMVKQVKKQRKRNKY